MNEWPETQRADIRSRTDGVKFPEERLLTQEERWQMSDAESKAYQSIFAHYDKLRGKLNSGVKIDPKEEEELRQLGEKLDKLARRVTDKKSEFRIGNRRLQK